jgi:hypothetical protein
LELIRPNKKWQSDHDIKFDRPDMKQARLEERATRKCIPPEVHDAGPHFGLNERLLISVSGLGGWNFFRVL